MKPTMPAKTEALDLGIDRSDRSIAICLMAGDVVLESREIASDPATLMDWWLDLRSRHGPGLIRIAFEQPALNLLLFFGPLANTEIYPLNPSIIWNYRQSLKLSRAHTDQSDAACIARFLLGHHTTLRPYQTPDSKARALHSLNQSRRKLVDQRTALTNRLQAVLKQYYPQALELLHENIHREINLALLKKWPNPMALKRCRESTFIDFFHAAGSRSAKRLGERLAVKNNLYPLTEDPDLLAVWEVELLTILEQVQSLNALIKNHDQIIAERFSQSNHAPLFNSLPGAGKTLAPRLLAAFDLYAPLCDCASGMAALSGMAPVTEQSGKSHKVYRRMRCDHFLRQTFHEYAKESWKHSAWARAYVKDQQAKGKHFHTIVRCLAQKWIRIIWRCYQSGSVYSEVHYIENLRKRGSPLIPLIDLAA
jgi:transposase